jgi:hypothetical protein
MSWSLDTSVPPEVYPISWLVGSWRGEGTIGYGPVAPGRVWQEIAFAADQGPYLSYWAKTWLLPGGAEAGEAGDPAEASGADGPAGAAQTDKGGDPGEAGEAGEAGERQLWHEEAGFWRVPPHPDRLDPPFDLEVLISDGAGYQSLYVGEVNGPRVDLGTDAVLRTASAPEVTAATRMYGLVGGDLLWAWDIAAFGEELGSFMAARLRRQEA